jgi:hypothetical protein
MFASPHRRRHSSAPSLLLPCLLLGSGLLACAGDGPRTDPGLEPTSASERLTRPAAREVSGCAASRPDGLPDELRCTGLYADWENRTIDPEALPYAPAFELWSDGAKKSRFVRLPPGGTIDATDMNGWVFPVGTKFWKEFRLPLFGNPTPVPVETRMLEKLASGRWAFATYVWSSDGASATRVETGVNPVPGSDGYEIPSERMCNRCHVSRADKILGFEGVLLAGSEATGLTYDRLLTQGLLRRSDGAPMPSSADLAIPGNPVERNAIGRLHANCGIACHNPNGAAPFSLRIDVEGGRAPAAVTETSVFREAIGQESFFTPDGGSGGYYRIRPTDETRSMIFYRMSRRDAPDGFEQMPPLATHRPDQASLDAVRSWIRSMKGPPYPAPGPTE